MKLVSVITGDLGNLNCFSCDSCKLNSFEAALTDVRELPLFVAKDRPNLQ